MKKNRLRLIFAFVLAFACLPHASLLAQGNGADEVDTWQILSMVMMKKQFDEDLGIDVEMPLFGKKVKALNGEEVTVRGYVLPLNISKDQKYFILSAVPYNQCFFCGGAGPESVMEVFAKAPVEMTQKPVTIRGTLRVNLQPSIGQVLYTLKDAQLVK